MGNLLVNVDSPFLSPPKEIVNSKNSENVNSRNDTVPPVLTAAEVSTVLHQDDASS